MPSRSATASTGFVSDTPCQALAAPSLSTAIPRKCGVPIGSKVVGSPDLVWGPQSIELCEDVIGLGSYGKTLTVLHGIEFPDDQNEDEDEDEDEN
jgi:hypothetical protein